MSSYFFPSFWSPSSQPSRIKQIEELFEMEQVDKEGERGKVMEGVGSIALLPSGSISGHFVQLPDSVCYGLYGTEIACERECSRGKDYRLIKLTITDFNSKRERDVVVECRGHDAARLSNVDHAHGWEKDVVGMLDVKNGKSKICVSFVCETLKAEDAAEDHIRKFMPKLVGMDAVVNIGPMSITGLEFETEAEKEQNQQNGLQCTSSLVPDKKANVSSETTTDFEFEEETEQKQIHQNTSED